MIAARMVVVHQITFANLSTIIIILVNHISLHGWGNASSIASRSTTAIGRELLSGCLRTYSNPISTICFALINDLSSGTQILIGSVEFAYQRIKPSYKPSV